jgi:hypothetical protein
VTLLSLLSPSLPQPASPKASTVAAHAMACLAPRRGLQLAVLAGIEFLPSSFI